MSDHELRDKIAKKLYVERLMHEMSQSELAEKIGTRKSNVSRMEKGRQNISVDYLEVLANAFDKDIELVLSDHQVSYGDTTEYSLRLYDDALVSFSMKRGDTGIEVKVLDVNEDKRDLFPHDLEV